LRIHVIETEMRNQKAVVVELTDGVAVLIMTRQAEFQTADQPPMSP
jgi:hypothetical protein